ncbi:MAG: YbjP/YqhG family protein [Acidobacteriota bacterium]|nr:YbjP/YqhG family protein [Acidobacteriota bacterium]
MKTLFYFLLVFILFTATSCFVVQRSETVNVQSDNAQQVSDDAGSDNAQSNVNVQTVQQNSPDDVVKDLYRQHDAKKSPFFQTKSRALVDKFFAKKLADLIWKDANDSKGEVGALGADPLYDAQDVDIKKFNVGAPKIENDRATVVVTFENFGKKTAITYSLARSNADWKITDIKYPDGTSLVRAFEDYAANTASEKSGAEGEFEGNYQVGETTCIVQPSKMSYEVRWKKGAGAMVFFHEEDYRFVSEEKENGRDAFIFDDASLTTGKFVRADGKIMPVKKIK